MRRIRLCTAALVAVSLLVPAAASAHRTATTLERTTILAAAVHQGEISSTQAACQTVTVSTVNTTYAVLAWPARLSKSCQQVASNGVIVEEKKGVTWSVVAAGSTFACPIKTVPITIARDLGVCH